MRVPLAFPGLLAWFAATAGRGNASPCVAQREDLRCRPRWYANLRAVTLGTGVAVSPCMRTHSTIGIALRAGTTLVLALCPWTLASCRLDLGVGGADGGSTEPDGAIGSSDASTSDAGASDATALGDVDVSAPAIVTNLTAVARSASEIELTWDASTDNTGISQYRILRCSGAGCTPTAQIGATSTTSLTDGGLGASTSYTYRVIAVDLAGNASIASANATAITPAPGDVGDATADFQARCSAAGVVLCEGFDDAAKFTPPAYPGSGLYPAGDGKIHGSRDTAIKTSGAGSLKLSGMASGANTAGQWVQDIGTTFGQNSMLYVQYRYRISPEMLSGNGGGRKLSIFHYAFNSCADLEITTQNTYYRGFPQMYTDCGAQSAERTLGSAIYLQQGADPFPTGPGWNCLYGSTSAATCALFQANTWMTLYYRITIGTWGQANSKIEAFVGLPGQPLKQFINMPNYRINNAAPVFPGIDHITLTPYDTGATTARNGSVWYDELIVSTQSIAPPP